MGSPGETYDNQTIGFQLGTLQSTILSAPINYSAELFGFNYKDADPGATVEGLIQAVQSIGGTVIGTIDIFALTPGNPNIREITDKPIARLEAGDSLVGVVTIPSGAAGSIEGVVNYRYIPGRLSPP